jgi:hypothetical protein
MFKVLFAVDDLQPILASLLTVCILWFVWDVQAVLCYEFMIFPSPCTIMKSHSLMPLVLQKCKRTCNRVKHAPRPTWGTSHRSDERDVLGGVANADGIIVACLFLGPEHLKVVIPGHTTLLLAYDIQSEPRTNTSYPVLHVYT